MVRATVHQSPNSSLDPGAVGMKTPATEAAAAAVAEAAKKKPGKSTATVRREKPLILIFAIWHRLFLWAKGLALVPGGRGEGGRRAGLCRRNRGDIYTISWTVRGLNCLMSIFSEIEPNLNVANIAYRSSQLHRYSSTPSPHSTSSLLDYGGREPWILTTVHRYGGEQGRREREHRHGWP